MIAGVILERKDNIFFFNFGKNLGKNISKRWEIFLYIFKDVTMKGPQWK